MLPFRLSNAPEIFCRFLTSLLVPCSSFTRSYLDDILIFSSTIEQHERHLSQIVSLLSQNLLHLNLDKCHLFQKSVTWVGHQFLTTDHGIEITPSDSTLKTIQSIPRPQSKKDVQSFLGHSAYISAFVLNLSLISAPLTPLLKKDARFLWTPKCQHAFEELQDIELKFMTLHPLQSGLPTKITTNASNTAVGAALWQLRDYIWYPVAYRSSKLNKFRLNWPITDKELRVKEVNSFSSMVIHTQLLEC